MLLLSMIPGSTHNADLPAFILPREVNGNTHMGSEAFLTPKCTCTDTPASTIEDMLSDLLISETIDYRLMMIDDFFGDIFHFGLSL